MFFAPTYTLAFHFSAQRLFLFAVFTPYPSISPRVFIGLSTSSLVLLGQFDEGTEGDQAGGFLGEMGMGRFSAGVDRQLFTLGYYKVQRSWKMSSCTVIRLVTTSISVG